jgi:hypothetical protein
MNWDAIGAIGEIAGAIAVILTLVYLASQVRYAKNATLDQNRLTRSSGIREIILATASNDTLRVGLMKAWGVEGYYESRARELGIDSIEASRNEYINGAHIWLYWGQWISSHEQRDLKELEHIICSMFKLPGFRHTWDVSPLGKIIMDEDFVKFVDGVLERNAI